MTFIWNYDFADSANCQLSWQLIDRIISGFCLKYNIFVAELSFVTKSRFFDKDEVCNFRHMCWVSPNFHSSWSDSIKLRKLIDSPWNHLLIKSVNINRRIVWHVLVISNKSFLFLVWFHKKSFLTPFPKILRLSNPDQKSENQLKWTRYVPIIIY